MSAEIVPLTGLHGAGLEAFRTACALVDDIRREPLFDPRAESLLLQVRALLGYAVDVEAIDAETAKAFGARAANKLALARHMDGQ